MMFTRAAMSCARGVRLVEMLGLHRLDSPPDETCPTLLPPNDWAELEERRRTFWGMFCIDSHCSISTGWPHLIDPTDVTTHLPTNEAAFHSGKEMKTCSLHDAFKGHSYSSFAATILVCNLFNQILRHVHRPKPSDCPENYEFGGFWQRHREIDNMLSSAFMFLPENFRLPEHYCDPTAVHTNLNLHASVICLHHAAIEKIDMHKLPEHAKTISQNRLRTSAQEIVNIMKLTSHVASNPKTPLASLSLYCAASVYIYFCEETQTPTNVDNLDFILAAMESFARSHVITRAFLRQVLLDIECNRVQDLIRLPRVNDLLEGSIGSLVSHNIPLLARTRVARHSKAQPVLPGRLPLGRPVGKIISDKMHSATNDVTSLKEADSFLQDPDYENSSSEGNANKRKRTAASTLDSSSDLSDPLWNKATPSSHSSPQNSVNPAAIQSHVYEPGIGGAVSEVRLPHRVGSPSTSSNFQSFSRAQKMASPLQSTAVRSESNMFGDFASMPTTTEGKTQATLLDGGQGALDSWDPGSMDMYSQFVDKIGGDINKTANMMDKNSQFNF
ncbi:hypothetical protein F5Y15DRAFT_256522 [Xylariaceae sp. FL0016]|nr:hypothetical protein F5Y15DRAFT_256522 [Xylariaceae sp. FL0016]